ncbi:hypothetical protein [Amycolatopsis vastitatis]|uniref:Uncharacterized protein n=1 Tax=Amycolatopsis vastitatis TaxID=1905142 RepID=A0A229TEI4_9PSEU|nr:hypothetical protein [Amycolatopsis vastitatis]OXM69672.1 hypothetical protein CF165_09185 [Amycolatopsis vastitatis]
MTTLHSNVTVDNYAEVLAITEAELKAAEEVRDRLKVKFEGRTAPRSEAETDPAIVSGIRRRTTPTQAKRADAKFDLDIEAYKAYQDAERRHRMLLTRVERLRESPPVPYTEEELKAATAVRTDDGWFRLLKVNRVTVAVNAGFPWPHPVRRDRVLEVRRSEVTPDDRGA